MKYITIDLWKPYHAPIEVVQREAGARTLAFQITDGGVALDLSDKVVTFYATKPDDSIVFNTCTVTGVGKCTYLLTAQTCAVVGDLSCALVITGTGYEARTQPFTVTVIASPDYTSAVESTDEFTALAALAGDIAQNTADIATAEGRLDDIEAVSGIVKGNSAGTYTAATEADIPRAGGATYPFAAMPYVGDAPIVASGSGYVKYADGTMMCWGVLTVSIACATAMSTGGGYRSNASTFSFGQTFFAAPLVVGTNLSPNDAMAVTVNSYSGGNPLTTGYVQWRTVSSASATERSASWLAIGRWKA